MLLAFGTTQKPQPSILPSDTVTVFDVNVPVDRFILAGIGDRHRRRAVPCSTA